jgi:hypothetical protein
MTKKPPRRQPPEKIRDFSWAAADRLRIDAGAEQETHSDGISLEELKTRYAAPDGGPSAEGFQRFCGDLFTVTLTPQQQNGARDLASEKRVLIVGGNGLGKDTLAGCWSLYEVFVLDALVLVTAPTDRQVKEILMSREIGARWRHARERLPGVLLDRGLRIPGRQEGGLLAFTATDADHFQGHHSARLFIAATESQGIERAIFNAMKRCLPKLTLLTANPTSILSPVYSFAQSSAWTTQHWSALDHPNYTQGRVVVPGAVTHDEVEDARTTDGENSRHWQESILGVWVKEIEDGLVEPEDCQAAKDAGRAQAAIARIIHLDPENPTSWDVDTGRDVTSQPSIVMVAIDPAGKGRDSTGLVVLVCIQIEGQSLPLFLVWALHRFREPDSVTNAERCTEITQHLVHDDRLAVNHVICDETSLNAVLAPLKRLVPARVKWTSVVASFPYYDLLEHTPDVRGFNASWAALAPARFANLRTQAYVELGEALREGRLVFGPGCDPALVDAVIQELLVHQVHRQPDGKWQLTPKAEIKAHIGRSPDLSDPLSMALLPWLKKEKAEIAPQNRRKVRFA